MLHSTHSQGNRIQYYTVHTVKEIEYNATQYTCQGNRIQCCAVHIVKEIEYNATQ